MVPYGPTSLPKVSTINSFCADGTSVYMTQDIGTAKLSYRDYPIDRMIYVVGNEQNYHFQVLSLLLDRLGFKWGKDLTYFSYGMVELPEGKMKSREGTVVDADDPIDTMSCFRPRDFGGQVQDMDEKEASEVARMVGLGAPSSTFAQGGPAEEHAVQSGRSQSISTAIPVPSSSIPTPGSAR